MQSRKRFRILVLMLCASLLAGGSFASVASARHHLSKAQKARIRAKLAREVKANPKIVLKRSFMKQAGQVSYTLPVTLRFRTADDGVTKSTLNLDLGTLGVKSIALTGYLPANATFIDPSASGTLGELRVSIPPVGPGTVGGVLTGANGVQYNGGSATLMASPLSILTNPSVTAPGAANATAAGGCNDYSSASLGTPGSYGVGAGYTPGTADPSDNPANTALLGLDANTVFRTPWLPVGVAPVGLPADNPPNGLSNTQKFTGPSGGTAYLFGNPADPNKSVDVTLNALTNINSILRDVNTGNALFAGFGRQCAQTITGYVPNVLTAHVQGTLAIRPDVTNDGRLRLAVATLTGGSVPDAITACVAPFRQYAAPAIPRGSAANITGLSQNPFSGVGVNTAVVSEDVAAGDPSSAPQVPCGTSHTGVGGVPTVGDPLGGANPNGDGLGGNIALYGNTSRAFPSGWNGTPGSGDTPINGAPSGLPGVVSPTPCGPTDYSGCEISLNGTLTPGTITADVLIGQANNDPLTGGTDRPPATNAGLHFNPSTAFLVGHI